MVQEALQFGTFTIHRKNARTLEIEIYKYLNELPPSKMDKFFTLSESTSRKLKNQIQIFFEKRIPRTKKNGTESISHCLTLNICCIVPKAKKYLQESIPYLCLNICFFIPEALTYVTVSISYLLLKIWSVVPEPTKNVNLII